MLQSFALKDRFNGPVQQERKVLSFLHLLHQWQAELLCAFLLA